MTMTVTLRRVNEHRLVIEGPFGGTRGYVRATPSGRLILENRSGRRVGSVRALPDGERGHRRVPPGAWLLGIARLNLLARVRTSCSNPIRSAKTPCRDILFRLPISG
jgi:hypothetical protein